MSGQKTGITRLASPKQREKLKAKGDAKKALQEMGGEKLTLKALEKRLRNLEKLMGVR